MDNKAREMAERSMKSYRSRGERAALRCGLGDAVALCDALAREITAQNKGRGGRGGVTKQGVALAAIATKCGDAIWAMRDLIHADDLEAPQEAVSPSPADEAWFVFRDLKVKARK